MLGISAIAIGLLQISVVALLYGILRWGFDPDAKIPDWIMAIAKAVHADADRRHILGVLLMLALGAILAKVGLSFRQVKLMSKFVAEAERRLSADLMLRVMMSPYQWLVRQNLEKVRQHILEFVYTWARDILGGMVRFANDLFAALLIIAMMVFYNPRIGFSVILVGGLIASFLFLALRPRLRRLGLAKHAAILDISVVSRQCIDGIKDIKLSSRERDFAREHGHAMQVYADVNVQTQSIVHLPRHILEAVAYLAVVLVCAYVLFDEAPSSEASGALLLYALAGMRLLPSLSTIVSTMSTMTTGVTVVSNLRQLIADTPDPPAEEFKLVWPSTTWHSIRFEHVTLRFEPGKPPAVSDLTIAISRGRRYGVIGQSGAGKSSFLDLLAGLLSPSDGSIDVDGVALTAENQLSWRLRFGCVSQHPFLSDTSLRENIVFERGTMVDSARLAHAITTARLDGVVSRLRGGVDGRIGDRGTLLSGGERQRVAIARAIYRGADILILDEPTSALDAIVEAEIAESLRALYGTITTIVVSHRAALIRDCDEIFVFDEGRLVARAAHEELRKTSPLYMKMLDTDGTASGAVPAGQTAGGIQL